MDDPLADVVQRELALLTPEVRRDPDRVRALLHPDFLEHGASGRVWNGDSVTAPIAEPALPIRATDLRLRRVGPDAVLLTYRSTAGDRSALRSSLWVREGSADWLLLFHQGTPAAEDLS